jgi:hypothetical protein
MADEAAFARDAKVGLKLTSELPMLAKIMMMFHETENPDSFLCAPYP